MTAEVVNLRQARKAKARAGKLREAEANRTRHGRTKGQRAVEDHDRERARRELDGARRDTDVTPHDDSDT